MAEVCDEFHGVARVLQKELFYWHMLKAARDGSEMSPLLICGWGTWEEGDALAWLCNGTCEPTSQAAAWWDAGEPAWGLPWEPPILQFHGGCKGISLPY